MRFSALRGRLPVLPAGEPLRDAPRIGRGGAPFSDDLLRAEGGRLAVRVRLTDRERGGYLVDLRDCDAVDPTHRFGLTRDQTLTACVLALGEALGRRPSRAWADALELCTEPGTWVDDEGADDPAGVAFGMARTYDAVLGAFGHAWKSRVGAGSCSLGAVVELSDGDTVVLTEVLPGGQGGRPEGVGASAWCGPILPSEWPDAPVPDGGGVVLTGHTRSDSGGGGKHRGGDGVVRRYRVARPLVARVAFDRVRNPPHGIDGAGPPHPTRVEVQDADGTVRAVAPWSAVELGADSTLVVQTCGGAGWGFPGYGEIEWDPSEWFGSDAKGE